MFHPRHKSIYTPYRPIAIFRSHFVSKPGETSMKSLQISKEPDYICLCKFIMSEILKSLESRPQFRSFDFGAMKSLVRAMCFRSRVSIFSATSLAYFVSLSFFIVTFLTLSTSLRVCAFGLYIPRCLVEQQTQYDYQFKHKANGT